MPPVIVPIVHVKVLGISAVKVILGLEPLQMLKVGALVTFGLALAVTVIEGVGKHPAREFVSLTITVYRPGLLAVIEGVVAPPGFQRYVYGAVPPTGFAVRVILAPEHITAGLGEIVAVITGAM